MTNEPAQLEEVVLVDIPGEFLVNGKFVMPERPSARQLRILIKLCSPLKQRKTPEEQRAIDERRAARKAEQARRDTERAVEQRRRQAVERAPFERVFVTKHEDITWDLVECLIRAQSFPTMTALARHFNQPAHWALALRQQMNISNKEWRACFPKSRMKHK